MLLRRALRRLGGHEDPRWYLQRTGEKRTMNSGDHYHESNVRAHLPAQNLVEERGKRWVYPQNTMTLEEAYGLSQHPESFPFTPRKRMWQWGDHRRVMQLEWFFFYVPTIILAGLLIPSFAMMYANDEPVNTSMTVKVTGRQWYWVYEVEKPIEEDDD